MIHFLKIITSEITYNITLNIYNPGPRYLNGPGPIKARPDNMFPCGFTEERGTSAHDDDSCSHPQ